MNRQKKLHSKVFKDYNMDIVIDRDSQHQKVWSDKIQQPKHVQQMKQIDRIFQGIVKQRIFGTIISEKSRLSNQEYVNLDKINKTMTNSFRNTRFTQLNRTLPNSPTKKTSLYSFQTPARNLKDRRKQTLQPLSLTKDFRSDSRNKAFTIDRSIELGQTRRFHLKDSSSGERSPNMSANFNLNSAKFPSSQQKYLALYRSKTDVKTSKFIKKQKRKQSLVILKDMNLNQNDLFQKHFKGLSLTPQIFLYDIKITKQTIISKIKEKVNSKLVEYFFYFFNFPSIIGYRQFKNGIQKAFNSPISLIYFFTFRVLDQSGNGFLTISDLFRFLQKYSQIAYIEQEIFKLRKKINQISQQLTSKSQQIDKRNIKPSLEQILLVNHKLKCDQVQQLLKQSIKQELNQSGQVKLTCYSQSILSLQHDVHVRLKQYQLQTQKNQSQAMNANKKQNGHDKLNNGSQSMYQDGLRLSDYSEIFNGHRPKIFCLLVNLLTGLSNQEYQ